MKKKTKALNRMYKLTTNNKDLITLCGIGICLNCGYRNNSQGFNYITTTAVCPECEVDMVVPNTSSHTFQNNMKEYWLKPSKINYEISSLLCEGDIDMNTWYQFPEVNSYINAASDEEALYADYCKQRKAYLLELINELGEDY